MSQRPLIAVLAAALSLSLAGCGSGPSARLMDQALASSVLAPEKEAVEPAPVITRELVESVPYAIASLRLPGQEARGYLVASAVNNGHVTYISADRRSIILQGDALTGTRGLGVDLVGYRSDPALDPLVSPRPPKDWPSEVVRVYRFRGDDMRVFSRVLMCSPRVVGEARVEVLERVYDVVEIEERCNNRRHSFVNRYWVDPRSGVARKSVQWMGPAKGSVEIEMVRRFRG